MKDLIIPVNNEALARALIAVAGEEQTKLIVTAYGLIDQAMVFGYEKAVAEEAETRKKLAEEYVEALSRLENNGAAAEGFKAGYDAGFEAATYNDPDDMQESYDDGYVDGVADARAFPDFADDQVSLLCASEEFYEGDSGDEDDGVSARDAFKDDEYADWRIDWEQQSWDAAQEYSADGERLY